MNAHIVQCFKLKEVRENLSAYLCILIYLEPLTADFALILAHIFHTIRLSFHIQYSSKIARLVYLPIFSS